MDAQLLAAASVALKKAALNEEAKAYVLQNAPLYQLLKKAADRYIGGETLAEALATIGRLQAAGFVVTTDFMGESIRNAEDAAAATAEFVALARALAQQGLQSSLSLDLSHIGLLVSKELALQHLQQICEAAALSGQEVIISMEGTDRTDAILDLYQQALRTHPNLGITIQAYLHRTRTDLAGLLALPGSIRLVKGAYDAPAGLAMPRGPQLDEVYLQYAERLLAAHHPCALATHHEALMPTLCQLIDTHQPPHYVLERLLGIGNEELAAWQARGYRCRLYVVYGQEWYLYLCNRLAEYPLHLFRALGDMVG